MENELYLCRVHADYLKYLHSSDSRVRVKYNNRPYVGVIVMINGVKYVLPLTSQTTQLRAKEGRKKRAARVTTFVRDSAGNEIANILHNNMIPVKDGCYEYLNINASEDTYEANEIRFIRKHRESIINKAKKVHDDRLLKNDHFLYRVCCDFAKLEKECEQFFSEVGHGQSQI